MNHRYKLRVRHTFSPYENFLNKKALKKILKTQLKGGGNINNNNIRAALSVFGGQSVGQFNTGYAKYFCSQFNKGKNILDPCAGFGSRLVGCVATNSNYFGIEPSNETYEGLCNLQEWLKGKSDADITLIHGCVEDQNLPSDFFDMAITSPPYFNKEEYDYNPLQSFIRYPDFNMWCEKFLKILICKVYQSLKKDCFFILNIDNVDGRLLTEIALRYAKSEGFTHVSTLFSSNITRPGTSKLSTEPFFILKKG
jgi:predicted RNA methylase